MISIKSKRKKAKNAHEEHNLQLSSHKREQLLDGGIDLVNIIFENLQNDTIGLMQLTKSMELCAKQHQLHTNSLSLLSLLKEMDDTLSQITDIVTNVKIQKIEVAESIHSTLSNIILLCNKLSDDCKEFKSNQLNTLHSVYRLKEQIHKCKSYTDESNLPMQNLITQMEDELQKLEANISIAYVRNDQTLDNLPIATETSIMYSNKSDLIKDQLSNSLSSIQSLINQLHEVHNKIGEVSAMAAYIEQSDQLASTISNTLADQKQNNIIMLGDLVSFIVQLKSILNTLKEEPINK